MTDTSNPVYYSKRAGDYLRELWRRREFAWYLAIGNFRARNASTALGLFWWVLNPLLLSGVYFVIFGLIFPVDRDIIYLMSGMFVFHFTAQSLSGGANSVLQNSRLLVNVPLPRIVLPIAGVIEKTLGFLVSLGLLLVLAVPLAQSVPGPALLLLLITIPLQLLFNLGLACLAGRFAVPFRDIKNVIPYITRIWLYLSPIIWPLSLLDRASESVQELASWNPMFSIISVYRTALLDYPFDPVMLGRFVMWSFLVGVVGVAVFIKYEGKMARYL